MIEPFGPQNPYVETAEGTCILAEDRELPREPAEDAILTFKFNFGEKRFLLSLSCFYRRI